jgi:hypothetical protein
MRARFERLRVTPADARIKVSAQRDGSRSGSIHSAGKHSSAHLVKEIVMQAKDSEGRHGGNRGASDKGDDNPNRRKDTKAESQATNRNENKGGQGEGKQG